MTSALEQSECSPRFERLASKATFPEPSTRRLMERNCPTLSCASGSATRRSPRSGSSSSRPTTLPRGHARGLPEPERAGGCHGYGSVELGEGAAEVGGEAVAGGGDWVVGPVAVGAERLLGAGGKDLDRGAGRQLGGRKDGWPASPKRCVPRNEG